MIDLVITHLTHPWGPPWTLETLGDPWRPLTTLGDMPENGHFGGKCPFSGAQKWDFECPNPKSETTFSRQHPPKMVEQVFVLFIYHFWTRNRQILNFEHFELVLACFYSVKRAFSTKWWPGQENAPKIIFFAFLVSFHINTTYIKLDWNSDNFLIFWCTLVHIHILSSFTGQYWI